MLMAAKTAKTPPKPRICCIIGKAWLTAMVHSHIDPAQRLMLMPRTLVGKISAHMMFGIGPKPVTKEQQNAARPRREHADAYGSRKLLRLVTASSISDAIIPGMVRRSNRLQLDDVIESAPCHISMFQLNDNHAFTSCQGSP